MGLAAVAIGGLLGEALGREASVFADDLSLN